MTPTNYVALKSRGLIEVRGSDSFSFLQGLVTNDLTTLNSAPFLHACLLTPQGKFLHDFYISKSDGGYTLECEGKERTDDLAKRLSFYKLRANIDIIAQNDVTIFASPAERSVTRPAGFEIRFEEWDTERIKLGLPDGSRDAEIGVSTLAEINLDESAASYTKGCYIGQELVARMHNRNLGKKHLVPARFKHSPPPFGTEIGDYGTMRSSCGSFGLIVMNRDRAAELKDLQNDESEIHILGL